MHIEQHLSVRERKKIITAYYEAYFDRLINLANRKLKDKESAETLVHDAIIKLMEKCLIKRETVKDMDAYVTKSLTKSIRGKLLKRSTNNYSKKRLVISPNRVGRDKPKTQRRIQA